MSDEKDKPGRGPGGREPGPKDSPELLERYGRKGGSARRPDAPKAGFWQRLAGKKASTSAAGGSATEATGPQRAALELILPDGKRVLVVVRAPGELPTGVLELELEAAPVNDPRVLAALAQVSHGGEAAASAPGASSSSDDDNLPEVAGTVDVALEDDEPPPPIRGVTPMAPLEPAGVIREEARGPRPSGPMQPVRGPGPSTSMQPLRGAGPSGPMAPIGAGRRPPSSSMRPAPAAPAEPPGMPTVSLDELEPTPPPRKPFGAGLSQLDTNEFHLPAPDGMEASQPEPSAPAPAPEPPPAASPPRRGPSRGGAARALFMPSDEKEKERDKENNESRTTPDAVRPTGLRQPGPARPAQAPARDAQPPREALWPTAPPVEVPRPDLPPAPGRPDLPPRPEPTPARGSPAVLARGPAQPSVILEELPPPEELAPPPNPQPDPRRRHLPVVGIDFGTTYSSVAVMRAGIEVIPDESGELQMPSVVSFPEPGVVLVGSEARARMAGSAQWTIASPKRLLGRLYRDQQVSQLIGHLAFRTFPGTDKFIRFEAHNNIYSVTDICAMILGKLRERACRFLDAEVSKAVFTVPVGFGTLQRSALEIAARQAGLEISGLLTEPSAAVLSHGFRGRRGLVAVYDFGGGTFDFCLLEVTDTAFQVLCAGGDTWLGGDDFDTALASYMADLFWNDTGVDLRTRAVEWQALVFACERAKRELSAKKDAEVRCDDLLFTQEGKRGLRYKVTRKKFTELTKELVDKSMMIANKVLSQAGVNPKDIDSVVLTGGTSLIPLVRDAVNHAFGKAPVLGDPNLAVAKGAALRGAELAGEAIAETSLGGRTLREVSGRTIGAAVQGGPVEVLFERSTQLPAEVHRAFHTTADGQTEMVLALFEESKSRIDESRTIGHLRYKGLRPAPRGQARVDFTFVLDEDGILHVSANVEGKQYDKSIKLE